MTELRVYLEKELSTLKLSHDFARQANASMKELGGVISDQKTQKAQFEGLRRFVYWAAGVFSLALISIGVAAVKVVP